MPYLWGVNDGYCNSRASLVIIDSIDTIPYLSVESECREKMADFVKTFVSDLCATFRYATIVLVESSKSDLSKESRARIFGDINHCRGRYMAGDFLYLPHIYSLCTHILTVLCTQDDLLNKEAYVSLLPSRNFLGTSHIYQTEIFAKGIGKKDKTEDNTASDIPSYMKSYIEIRNRDNRDRLKEAYIARVP